MKFIKIYLAIVTVLLLIAIGLGVYVWYVLQTLSPGSELSATEEAVTVNPAGSGTSSSGSAAMLPGEELLKEKPVVIDVSTLSETQQGVLKSFGYKSETVTITAEMVACAKGAVGEARLTEIMGGKAPSPLESLALVPCLKR